MPWTSTIIPSVDNKIAKSRIMTYKDALHEATDILLEKYPEVIVMGEGVEDSAGIYGSVLNLYQKYGTERVFETPLAEQGMTGIAVGAAIVGLRPIYIHARMDFILLTLDQIINHASKYSYIFNGKASVPLVIRCIIARGWGSGAQHSQSLHSLLAHIPGLKIVFPSNPYDVKGMLITAVEDNNPVIFVEHRWLYNTTSYVPEGYYNVDYSKPNIINAGDKISIISSGYTSYQVLKLLKENPILKSQVELIDLRSINPIDYNTIYDSVEKTGNAIIIDESWEKGSIASDIAVNIYENCSSCLKNKVQRITLPNTPTPTAQILENAFYISDEEILNSISEVLSQ